MILIVATRAKALWRNMISIVATPAKPGCREIFLILLSVLSFFGGAYWKHQELGLAEMEITVKAMELLDEEQPERCLAALAWMARSGDAEVALDLAEAAMPTAKRAPHWDQALLEKVFKSVIRRDVSKLLTKRATALIVELHTLGWIVGRELGERDAWSHELSSASEDIAQIQPPLTKHLIEVLQDKSVGEARQLLVIATLGEIGGESAISALNNVLSSAETGQCGWPERYAAEALGKLRATGSVDLIIKCATGEETGLLSSLPFVSLAEARDEAREVFSLYAGALYERDTREAAQALVDWRERHRSTERGSVTQPAVWGTYEARLAISEAIVKETNGALRRMWATSKSPEAKAIARERSE